MVAAHVDALLAFWTQLVNFFGSGRKEGLEDMPHGIDSFVRSLEL